MASTRFSLRRSTTYWTSYNGGEQPDSSCTLVIFATPPGLLTPGHVRDCTCTTFPTCNTAALRSLLSGLSLTSFVLVSIVRLAEAGASEAMVSVPGSNSLASVGEFDGSVGSVARVSSPGASSFDDSIGSAAGCTAKTVEAEASRP
jgi:hypothetical protein